MVISQMKHFVAASILISASFTTAIGQTRNDDVAGLLQELHAKVVTHFSNTKDGLVAIYKGDVNYQIGDVWNESLTRLLEGSQQCFGHLNIRSGRDYLPPMQFRTEAAAGFMFGVKRIWDALFHATATHGHVVKIKYEDVTAQIVSEGNLRRAYRGEKQCQIVRPIINGEKVIRRVDAVIIGRLYWGRRDITISYGDSLAVDAQMKELTPAVSGLQVSAEGHVGVENYVRLFDKTRVPLAFAPAFVEIVHSSWRAHTFHRSGRLFHRGHFRRYYRSQAFDSLSSDRKRKAVRAINTLPKWAR